MSPCEWTPASLGTGGTPHFLFQLNSWAGLIEPESVWGWGPKSGEVTVFNWHYVGCGYRHGIGTEFAVWRTISTYLSGGWWPGAHVARSGGSVAVQTLGSDGLAQFVAVALTVVAQSVAFESTAAAAGDSFSVPLGKRNVNFITAHTHTLFWVTD